MVRPFALAGILALFAVPAPAQQPQRPDTLPPVETVATRIPEKPHDVPTSIEVIRGADLRARGATCLRDALALAAGVAIAPGGDAGPAGAVPEFWGLREFDAFLLVVDGIPWGGAFNPALTSLDLEDVERIEILRGPAPVTYGATSFVGVIQVIHNPASATRKTVSARGGSYGNAGGAVTAAAPIGSWRARISADFDRLAFRDDRTQSNRGHGMLRIARADEERPIWVMGDVSLIRQDPASPHPREGPALSDAVPLDANHNPRGAFLNEDRFVVAAGLGRPVFTGARWNAMASFTHSAQSIFRGFLTDVSNSPDNASGFRENIDINDVYLDTHLMWPTREKVRFVVGADGLFANGEGRGAVFTYTAPLDGSTAPAVSEPTVFDRDAEARRLFLGGYGSVEWQPVNRLTLSGGLRLNATSERRGEGENTTNTRLSGSVGALFGVWESEVDHLRVFASFRDTFKPAVFDFGLAENEGVLEPETSQAYEAGIKLALADARFDFEGSVFRMDFRNLVTSTVVDGQPALINAGTTRFQGFEVAADVRLPRDFTARATYSFHDGKFVDFVQAFDGTPTQLAGKRFEMSTRHLASAGFYRTPARGILMSANLNYGGDRYLNKRNTALAPKYVTLDAGIGYRAGRFELRIDGRNLTNRRDAVSESEFGDAQYYRMPARTILGSVTVRY
jgi:outer membrane receptor protein involved in Fe transport